MAAPHREGVIDIFNYYIEHGFAAYPQDTVPYAFFDAITNLCRGYPSAILVDADGPVAGFGMLRPHNLMPAFAQTAEVTYFIRPGLTGQGLGSQLLAHLEAEGKRLGITVVLANISSLNEGSIRFHQRHGFTECGRFRGVARKRGVVFDTVWMQKTL
jgi:phosphinothricin acetyltransferase